jgi:hypothetical protein
MYRMKEFCEKKRIYYLHSVCIFWEDFIRFNDKTRIYQDQYKHECRRSSKSHKREISIINIFISEF